jgi:hypothetical protein
MLIRTFAAAALATLATASAQAGTIQNGAWTPSSTCVDPGEVPHFSSKSPDAYNKSAKIAADWQGKAKTYADCVSADAKADQQAVITGANGAIAKINDGLNAMKDESQAAVEKLKKANAGGGQH